MKKFPGCKRMFLKSIVNVLSDKFSQNVSFVNHFLAIIML